METFCRWVSVFWRQWLFPLYPFSQGDTCQELDGNHCSSSTFKRRYKVFLKLRKLLSLYVYFLTVLGSEILLIGNASKEMLLNANLKSILILLLFCLKYWSWIVCFLIFSLGKTRKEIVSSFSSSFLCPVLTMPPLLEVANPLLAFQKYIFSFYL